MKNIKNISLFLIVFCLLFSGGSLTTIKADLDISDDHYLLEEGYELLEETEDYIIIGKSIIDHQESLLEPSIPNNNLALRLLPGVSISKPKLIAYTHDTYNPFDTDSIAGGGSTEYSVTRTISTTVEAGYGVDAKGVNTSLNLSTTASVSVTKTVGYECPITYRRCEIFHYDRFGIYNFNIYFLGSNVGTGSAHVIKGVFQSVKLYK